MDFLIQNLLVFSQGSSRHFSDIQAVASILDLCWCPPQGSGYNAMNADADGSTPYVHGVQKNWQARTVILAMAIKAAQIVARASLQIQTRA